jgi:hypothetical protein
LTRLAEIVAELLLFAQITTGYAPAVARPDVVFVSQAELQRQACKNPCKILGWYPNGSTVYLDKRLDPFANLQARGILLHELVHYLQHENGAYKDASACMNWARREREAYKVQAAWLQRNNVAASAFSGTRPPWSRICRDTSADNAPG